MEHKPENTFAGDDDLPARSQWLVGLAACDRQSLSDVAQEFSNRFNAQLTAVPNAGLGMLQVRDSVLNETFQLGEFSLSTASVELIGDNGQRFCGAAAIMADDQTLAIELAVCDAVLAHRLERFEQVLDLLRDGLQKLEARGVVRKQILGRTRVDFSLLNNE